MTLIQIEQDALVVQRHRDTDRPLTNNSDGRRRHRASPSLAAHLPVQRRNLPRGPDGRSEVAIFGAKGVEARRAVEAVSLVPSVGAVARVYQQEDENLECEEK